MNQITKQFTEECKITIKGFKSIGLEYSKRFVNGKEFGHMNDYQSYEKLSPETVANFIISKDINFVDVIKVQGCKNFNTFENIAKKISLIIIAKRTLKMLDWSA